MSGVSQIVGGGLNLKKVIDCANDAHDKIGKFHQRFTLSPEQLMKADYVLQNLSWASIPYKEQDISAVPNDRRGIYAFSVLAGCNLCPQTGYVLYIGIAGRRSNRSLRARYGEYRRDSSILKRPAITRMIGTWHEVLHFFFAPVDDCVTTEELMTMEEQLNGALLPPCSKADIEGEIKEKVRAF